MSAHIALLGDSIFDNAFYVPGEPSVIEHLRRILPGGWEASLIAVDGARVASVFRQMERIPRETTHVVLSVGGNDALWLSGDLFSSPSIDVRDSLQRMGDACSEFKSEYRRLVEELRGMPCRLTTCTIYDTIPGLGVPELTGLCVFNDVITRTAFATGANLIDLRVVCNEASDYAAVSPIEPSASGGAKIARAILQSITDADDGRRVIV